jgi:hypothetical protein
MARPPEDSNNHTISSIAMSWCHGRSALSSAFDKVSDGSPSTRDKQHCHMQLRCGSKSLWLTAWDSPMKPWSNTIWFPKGPLRQIHFPKAVKDYRMDAVVMIMHWIPFQSHQTATHPTIGLLEDRIRVNCSVAFVWMIGQTMILHRQTTFVPAVVIDRHILKYRTL